MNCLWDRCLFWKHVGLFIARIYASENSGPILRARTAQHIDQTAATYIRTTSNRRKFQRFQSKLVINRRMKEVKIQIHQQQTLKYKCSATYGIIKFFLRNISKCSNLFRTIIIVLRSLSFCLS